MQKFWWAIWNFDGPFGKNDGPKGLDPDQDQHFANSIKSHICHIKNSQQGTSVNDSDFAILRMQSFVDIKPSPGL